MEKRTPLYLYLEKMKQGDKTFVAKLCQQLSDRLIYVPTLSGPEGRKSQGTALKVKAVRLDIEGKSRIPIFTTEKIYRTWAEKFGEPTEYISLLGGDFCGALGPTTWLVIDPGADHSVELEPATAHKIAASTTTEFGGRTENDLPEPMFQEPGRGRSEPTSMMPRPQRPQVELDSDSVAERKQALLPDPTVKGDKAVPIQEQLKKIKREQFPAYKPEANEEKSVEETQEQPAVQRTVIFSPDTDANRVVREKEDPNKKKKRSFLNFLKGS